jgi:hypothetical protein
VTGALRHEDYVLKGCFPWGIFWSPKTHLKGTEDFNFEHWHKYWNIDRMSKFGTLEILPARNVGMNEWMWRFGMDKGGSARGFAEMLEWMDVKIRDGWRGFCLGFSSGFKVEGGEVGIEIAEECVDKGRTQVTEGFRHSETHGTCTQWCVEGLYDWSPPRVQPWPQESSLSPCCPLCRWAPSKLWWRISGYKKKSHGSSWICQCI